MGANYEVPRYPAIRFFIAKGAPVAAVLAIACIVLGGLVWQATGWLWAWPVGIALAALLGGLMLAFVELLRIVAETLMPR